MPPRSTLAFDASAEGDDNSVEQADFTTPRPLSPCESDATEAADCGRASAQATAQPTSRGTRCGRAVLGMVGVVLALVTTVTDMAMQGLASRKGGVVTLAALTAARASLTWASTLFSFVFLGGMSIIGAAMGQRDDLRAGRYARLCIAISIAVGLLGAAVLAPLAGPLLSVFNQEAVEEQALSFFRLSALFFPLAVVTLALNGVLLGFLYVHVVVAVTCVVGCVTLATALPLYLRTDLGLVAFAVAIGLGAACGVALSLAYLLRGARRRKFGLDLGLRGIGLADVRDLGGSMGWLAFRSFVVNTPYLLTIVLSIRLSPVHGAAFQFLITQSGLAENIISGFGMVMNFIGSRLWGAKFHAAFWNVLCVLLLYVCTPTAIIFSTLELVRGRGSLARTLAKGGEQAQYDAVMTKSIFIIYILLTVVRSYYIMIEQAMIAMQELRKVALIQGISFVAYLCVAFSGYATGNFAMLFSAMPVFLLCRIALGSLVLGNALRTYKGEWYRAGSSNDPQLAIKLTIDDPAAARIFGGREAGKPQASEAPELAAV